MFQTRIALRSVSLGVAALLASVGLVTTTDPAQAADEWNPESSYTTTDAGDGTYKVPMLKSDVPDVSVERVPASQNDEGRDIYYMVSTTMHLSPGAPIMKSYDLVNWETVSYAFDRLDISDAASLRNGKNSYGEGQWASSIRFHDGTYYVLINSLNLGGAFLYRTDDIDNGAWTKTAFGRGFHDPSLFFDDANGGTPYIFYGGGGSSAVRLNSTLTAVEQEYPDVIRRSDYADKPYIGNDGAIFEGAQVSFIDGYYYVVMITWRPDGRQVVMFRSPELLGRLAAAPAPYESRGVLNSNGFAQGSLVPVSNDAGGDDWHGFFFRDSYPVGRIPALIPATWSNGWPTFGNNGVVPVDGAFEKPIRLTPEQERFERLKSVVASDDFDNDAPHHGFQDEEWTVPTPPDIDETLVGVELFANPGVESGSTQGWVVNDGATLSTTTDAHSGSTAIAVTGRTATGSGPAQIVTGKVQHNVTYDVSAWIKYDNPASPASKPFIITARYGGNFANLTPQTPVARGTWVKVSGTFTIPASQALSDVRIFVETPWVPDPSADPAAHLMDYKVDDVSLVGRASIAGELPNVDEITPNGSNLDLAWEWNHTPDNRYWSLTDREGWLRLTAGKVVTGAYTHRDSSGELTWLEEARNTLSQRSFGPRESAETKLDISGMKDGDVAGLAAFGQDFSYIGVKRVNGVNTVGVVHRGRPFPASTDQAAIESFVPGTATALGDATEVYVKADLDFTRSPEQLFTTFYYSLDGIEWTQLGDTVGPLMFGGTVHFMGHRVALFNYATQQTGGHVDFDRFLLSDTLTSQNQSLDKSDLDAAIAYADSLDSRDYPAEAWTAMIGTLAEARTVAAGAVGTQNQIDAPERALSYELARLGTLKAPAPTLDVELTAGTRCAAGKVVVTVRATNAEEVPIAVDFETPYGSKSVASVAPGASVAHTFTTRLVSVAGGAVFVDSSATIDGRAVSTESEEPYAARSCR